MDFLILFSFEEFLLFYKSLTLFRIKFCVIIQLQHGVSGEEAWWNILWLGFVTATNECMCVNEPSMCQARAEHMKSMWWACEEHVMSMWSACGEHVPRIWWACAEHVQRQESMKYVPNMFRAGAKYVPSVFRAYIDNKFSNIAFCWMIYFVL